MHLCMRTVPANAPFCSPATVVHVAGTMRPKTAASTCLPTCLAACELYLVSEGGYHSLTAPLVERALAFGFKAAAQSLQGLHLQSYAHHFATASVRHILAQLPVQHLQHLHLCWDDEQPYAVPVVPALAALTALTSLALSK